MYKINEEELSKINTRTKVFILFIFVLFSIIFARLFQIQVYNSKHYYEKSINNVTKEIDISPKRGDIYDRNGKLIASVRPIYNIQVLPEKIYGYKKNKKESLDDFFKEITAFINIKEDRISELKEKILKTPSFKEVTLVEDISQEQLSEMTYNLKYVDGISLSVSYVRHYPDGDLFLSALGYVGKISKKELQNPENSYVLSNDYIGKTGLEKTHNKSLYGVSGKETVLINANGKIVARQKSLQPVNGQDMYVSLDKDLQQIAKDEFLKLNKKGALIATNIKTGEILAFYSNPSFDANKFVSGLTKKEYNDVFSTNSPLFNRVTQGTYAPASTIKPFMSLAALSGKFIEENEIVKCGPYYSIGTQKFRDWKKWGHGEVDTVKAIASSVDVYYYKLAHQMGIDYMSDYLRYFGFGEKVELEIANQKSGLLPTNSWKLKTYKEPFYAGDAVVVGIGQGSFSATPIQLMNALMILLNKGEKIKLNFEFGSEKQVISKFDINESYLKTVKEGMRAVMHEKFGTSYKHGKGLDFVMGGKTGTSQVFSTKGEIEYENDEMPEHLRDHGLFMGYAPFDDPEIGVTVVVEHGNSGNSTAAPIAIEVIKKYMEKKKIMNEKINETEGEVKTQ